MTSDRAERMQQLFLAALELAPEERAAYLDETCSDDPALRNEIESLLEADAKAFEGAFLEHPTVKLAHPAPAESTESMEGRQIGPYRILHPLGQGGMGRVFLAEREDLDTQVALKLVRGSFIPADIRQRFLFERRVLARLNHPNIARLLDAGVTDDDMPYFVMEVVKGEPITDHCDHYHLDIEARLALFMTVCEAVQYAHQRLIVHRDLKPQNILVGDSDVDTPEVKLLDFGIAKMLAEDEDAGLTRTGVRVMTTQYAAPEQILGETITTATDVYALGLLLYKLLTGQHAYNVEGPPHEVSRTIVEKTPKKPSTVVREASASKEGLEAITIDRATTTDKLQRRLRGDLDVICLKALEKEPDRRYQSAEQLREDIQRYMNDVPVIARAPTVSYRVRKFVARHLVGVLISVLIVVAILSSLGVALWQAQRARTAAAHARAETATAELVKDYLADVFGASSPWNEPMGSDMTARELLERGVERVESLEQEPLVQAELLDVLGNVYGGLGLFEEARTLLEQSLATRKLARGEEHEEVAQSMASLAGLLLDIGSYEEAEPLYRETLELRRRLLGNNHNDVAASLNDLAALLNSMDAYEESEPLLRESLAIQRRLHKEEHPHIAVTLANLAGVLRSRGSYTESEALYREALAMQRKLLGNEHPNVAISLVTLSLVLRDQGRLEEAEPLMRESLGIRERLMGEEHDMTAGARHQLGRLLMDLGRVDEAEPLFRQATLVSKRVNGEQHWKTAIATVAFGEALTILGQYEEAEIYLNEARAFYQSDAPGRSPQRAEAAREALITLYTEWGKPEEALALSNDAIDP